MTAHAHFVGNLTADAEMRYTSAGAAVLEFTLAVNEPRRKDGSDGDPATFWRVTLWREDAETYANLLTKGTRVVVVGRPRVREYETRDGGKGRSPEIVGFPIVGIVPPRERTDVAPAADPWGAGGEGPGW